MKARFAVFLMGGLAGCGPRGQRPPEVVVYCSLDQNYSQPVLKAFEEKTGIKVLARYDTEADKTTGLYHRLLEERDRPRADVFWNSEALRTVALAKKGLLAAHESPQQNGLPPSCRGQGALWTGFAARVRVLVYNIRRVEEREAPDSIAALHDPRWRGRAAMALPLLGTTAAHAGALWARLGPEAARKFFQRLVENDVQIVSGNAMVRDLVASGEAALGLTDTDDAVEGIRRGDSIRMVFPDQRPGFPGLDRPLGAFLIPNTAALVKGGPNPEAAKKLLDFLISPETEQRLAASGSAQIPVRRGLKPAPELSLPADLRLLEVGFEAAARSLEEAEPFLKELFVR